MANHLINKALYDAILHFDESEEAQEYYYMIMNVETPRKKKDGSYETIREQILRIYGLLFCEDLDYTDAKPVGVDEVAATADRLHIGNMNFDRKHWYRMQHHFPVIDEDNYDRFAALVISDMNAGPLRDAAVNGGDTLLVGEADPFHMTPEQRKNQKYWSVELAQQEK